MAYCTSCGNQISEQAVACPKCGQPAQPSGVPLTGGVGPGAPTDLRPLGIGEIVDVAIKIYLRNFVVLVKVVAIVVVPMQLIVALVQASTIPDQFTTGPLIEPEFDPENPFVFDTGDVWAMLAGFVVIAVLGLVAQQLATGASLKAVADAYLGHEPEWNSSVRFALDRLGSLVWLGVLWFLLLMPAFVACILPGIWLVVAWSVSVPALMVEGERGWSALSRSFRLVRQRWWPTFAVLILGYIMVVIVQAIVGGIFSFVLPAAAGSLVVSFFSNAIGGAIGSVLTTPFLAAVIAVIYFDLRVRKEGFDLELLAQRIGGGPPGAGPGLGSPGGAGPGAAPPPPPKPPPRVDRDEPPGSPWEAH